MSRSKFIFLVLYVNNILLASSDLGLLHKTKNFLSEYFDMKDMKDYSYVLGIKIYHDRSKRLFGLSERTYITRILEKFGMSSCLSSEVPIIKGNKFSKF